MDLDVDQAVVPDPAGGSSSAIEVYSCCRGILFVDGDPALVLHAGKTAWLEVAEGEHRITFEVEGLRRWEANVTVAAGERVYMKPRRRDDF